MLQNFYLYMLINLYLISGINYKAGTEKEGVSNGVF